MNWQPYARYTLALRTRQRSEMVEITDNLQRWVTEKGVSEGMAIIYNPHTTAALAINENADPDVKRDVLAKLGQAIPKQESYYRHAEGNSDSHLKAVLTGSSLTVLIEQGKLLLGQWQGIYFVEFDGPRAREVYIKLIGSAP